MRSVYVFCADGFEEVEGLTAVDLLRRAGVSVTMVSIMGRTKITGARNISVNTDILIEDIKEEADMLVLPGGMPGTNYLRDHEGLAELLKKQYEAGKWVAAICAAPSVFGGLGFLRSWWGCPPVPAPLKKSGGIPWPCCGPGIRFWRMRPPHGRRSWTARSICPRAASK